MKNLILILLIFLGIMFYSCKRNPTGPEDLQKNYKLSIVVFGNIIFNTDVYSQFNDLRPPPYGGHSESRYFEDVTIKNQNLDFVNLIQDTTKLPQIKYIKENAWGMDYYILSIHPTKKLIYIELFKYYGNNNDPSQGSTQTVKISVNSCFTDSNSMTHWNV